MFRRSGNRGDAVAILGQQRQANPVIRGHAISNRIAGADQQDGKRGRSLDTEGADDADTVIARRDKHDRVAGQTSGFIRGEPGGLHRPRREQQAGDADELKRQEDE